MTARVPFSAATPMGQLAAEAVDSILEGKARLNRLAEALAAMIYPSDTAAIEAELGIPTGKGQQFFDLIAGAKAALDDASIVALREIDQG
ncbi:MAG: hypothetical protein U1E42_03585 [Rhodospirillales bacterium]